jgi:hypothetical protein
MGELLAQGVIREVFPQGQSGMWREDDDNFRDVDINGWIILKWVMKKQDVSVCTEFH